MKTALVLEGGGMRGAYTCGVLDSLMEKNITFDAVIGVSAGACHACSYISNQRGRAFRTCSLWLQDKRYMSLDSLFKTGDLFNAQFIYHDIPDKLDPYDYKTFNNSSTKLWVTCTDCQTGKPLYFPIAHIQEDIEYVRASASLPLISNIVEYNGYQMLDGGLSDSIPFEFMMNKGYDKIVVILTREKGYKKEENKAMPLIRTIYKNHPAIIHACKTRHKHYNEELKQLDQLEKEGKIFSLYPSELHVGRLEKDPNKLRELYQTGIKDIQSKEKELLHYLNNEVTQ